MNEMSTAINTSNPNLKPLSIIEEAVAAASGDRLASYGHPLDTYSQAAQRISQRLGKAITWREVILDMIDIKLSRQLHAHKRDNLVDIVGYVWCYDECEKEELRRNSP